MLREQCQIGMVIEFGRDNGQWTKGEIIKINPKMAKVRTMEGRGTGRGNHVGAIWSVSYSLMRPTNSSDALPLMPAIKDQADEPFPYNNWWHFENLIMEAISCVYSKLSPEYLTADGERPIHQVHALRGKLQNQLEHLFKVLGRRVSESVVFDWCEAKKEAEAKKAV
jgi:hypothetical protein